MGLLFHANGNSNFLFLSCQTMFILGLYCKTFKFNIKKIGSNDNSMAPFFLPGDIILYTNFRFYSSCNFMKNRIISLQNPQDNGNVIFRRVVGVSGEWMEKSDTGGFIQIPRSHIWIESENPNERGHDSVTTFGPITSKLGIG